MTETHNTMDIEKGQQYCMSCSDDVRKGYELPLQYTHVKIPCSNIERGLSKKGEAIGNNNMREVPILCAICLTGYTILDPVSWASRGSNCTHVFHRKCISHWFLNLLKSKVSLDDVHQNQTKLGCPMCRQDFVVFGGKRNVEVDIFSTD